MHTSINERIIYKQLKAGFGISQNVEEIGNRLPQDR